MSSVTAPVALNPSSKGRVSGKNWKAPKTAAKYAPPLINPDLLLIGVPPNC